jgi:hypothetical protein
MRRALFVLLLLACNKADPHPATADNSGTYPGGGGIHVTGDGGTLGDGGAYGVLVNLPTPTGIALDKTNVYVGTTSGDIVSVPRAGGTATTLASGVNAPGQMVVTAGQLFFLAAGAIDAVAVPKAAGVTTFASDVSSPSAIAATDTDVYWLELQQLGSTTIQLATRPAAGGAKRVVATSAAHLTPGPLVLWNGYAYFGYSDTTNALIQRTQLTAGGAPAETFAVVADGPIVDLATDGTNLYFIVTAASNVTKIEATPLTAGGAVSTIVADAGGAHHLVVTGGIIYYTAGSGSEVRAVDTAAANPPVPLVTNIDTPNWIAVDDATYATFATGVARLPK